MAKPVQIRYYAAVRIGTTDAARLTLEVCRSLDPAAVGRACALVGAQTPMSAWTVYRWLRGTRTPKAAGAAALRALAASPAIAA